MGQTLIANRRRRRKNTFQPNRSYIDDAVKLYLQSGKKITRVIVGASSYEDFVASKEHTAHDFLLEGC